MRFDAILITATVSAAAIIAGVGSFAGKRRAVWLGIAAFAVQTPIIVTRTFTFFVWLGIHTFANVVRRRVT